MNRLSLIPVLVLAIGAGVPAHGAQGAGAATPEQLVAAYESLADALLATNRAEWNLVHAILATTYGHAEAAMEEVRRAVKSGESAGPAVEKLAALVAQIGNEGDSSVAAIRKRLVDGGHHHNAAGEQQGIYDEGFVIVTRADKKVFLDASKSIGKMSRSPDLEALESEWLSLSKQFARMCEEGKS